MRHLFQPEKRKQVVTFSPLTVRRWNDRGWVCFPPRALSASFPSAGCALRQWCSIWGDSDSTAVTLAFIPVLSVSHFLFPSRLYRVNGEHLSHLLLLADLPGPPQNYSQCVRNMRGLKFNPMSLAIFLYSPLARQNSWRRFLNDMPVCVSIVSEGIECLLTVSRSHASHVSIGIVLVTFQVEVQDFELGGKL